MLHERRKFKRLDISHVIEINSHTTLLGFIRNFSYQGFSFELDSVDFKPKENIEFNLKHPKSNSSVSFIGDVAWERWVANTLLVGIKLKKMDKEIKDKIIEIICSIRDIPIDLFDCGKTSEMLKGEMKDENSLAKSGDKITSESPKNYKITYIRNFIIGLSISFFVLSGIITYKALRIPVNNTYYKKTIPKTLDPNEHLRKSENILRQPVKEQENSRIFDEDALSTKNQETQSIDNKSIIQVRSDKNSDTVNKSNGKLKVDDKYASQLVYTIQIESRSKIEDAKKQFNYMLRSINEKDINLLRVEKIGKLYTLRLGKFETYETAKKCIQENKSQLSEAIIVKAHIKNDRIIKLNE